jgi:hypothetical protein
MTMASQQEDVHALRERLVDYICSPERRISPRSIERLIRRRPEVLRATNARRDTLLHIACERGAPFTIIQMLVDLGPGVAEMINVHDQTPLHVACQHNRDATFETLSILIAAYPEALTARDNYGSTPLHEACCDLRESTAALQLLLAHTPSESLGMCNLGLRTPLNRACAWGVSIDVIRQMICMYPRALRMLDNYRSTLLHLACSPLQGRHFSLAVSCLLVEECPEACLVLDRGDYSPYDRAVDGEGRAGVCEFMLEATRDAAIALLKCAFSYTGLITIPPAVLAHMKTSISNAVTDLGEESFRNMSGRLLIQSVRPRLNQATLKSLLRNDDLQVLLKDEDFQDLIRGVYRINKLVQIDGNKVQGVRVLESISDTPVCMFLHLRNNPSLCLRDNVSTTITASSSSDNEASSMPHQQDPGASGPFESAELLTEATSSGSKRKAACLEL